MYTQCPECGTVFKVTPDVLRAARGVVRCGVCDATFNAVQSLSDRPSLPARAQPAPGSGEPEAPSPSGLSELHAKVAALQAGRPAADEPTGRHRALNEADIDDASAADLEFDAESTDWNTVFVAPRPPERGALQEFTHPPAGRTDSPREDDAGDDDDDATDDPRRRPAAASGRPDPANYAQLFRQTAAAAAGVQQKAAQGRALAAGAPAVAPATEAADDAVTIARRQRRDTPTDAELSAWLARDRRLAPTGRHDGAPATTARADDTPRSLPTGSAAGPEQAAHDHDAHEYGAYEDDGQDDEAHRETALEPAPLTEQTDEFGPEAERPAPLSITLPDPPEPGHYGLAVLLFTLLLCLQVAHFERESLAELPFAGPLVSRFYESIGLPIEPRWSLTDYDVKQLGAAGEVPGTLRVLARLQNRAARPQPYPLLRVTILDRFETKLGRREFTPAEYLPSRRRPPGLLGPEQRVDADLLLADPGKDAVSFELDVCLVLRGRLVCAEDQRLTP